MPKLPFRRAGWVFGQNLLASKIDPQSDQSSQTCTWSDIWAQWHSFGSWDQKWASNTSSWHTECRSTCLAATSSSAKWLTQSYRWWTRSKSRVNFSEIGLFSSIRAHCKRPKIRRQCTRQWWKLSERSICTLRCTNWDNCTDLGFLTFLIRGLVI